MRDWKNMWYYFEFFWSSNYLTLSICMRTCTTCLDISTSLAVNCLFLLEKARSLNNASTGGSFSSSKNPLSARTQCPRESISRNPEFDFINSSDTRPPHLADRKTNPTAWRDPSLKKTLRYGRVKPSISKCI